jgi:hypothetical protein
MPFVIDDIIIGAAISTAASAAIGGVSSYLGSKEQSKTARREGARMQEAGDRGNEILSQSRGEEAQLFGQGLQGGLSDYDRALGALQQNQTDLGGIYAQERGVGSAALQRMNDVILGGDMSQLQMDPAYGFRQAEGEKALQRQANAAGSFGSGANLKDFMRFNQDLASTEYNNAIGRLMGLTAIGQQANANYAGQLQQGASNIANTYGARGNFQNNNRMALANAYANNSAARANSLNNVASNVSAMNLQAANATAQGYAGVANAAGQFTNNLAMGMLLGGSGARGVTPAPVTGGSPNYGASITTQLPGQSYVAPASAYPAPMPLDSYYTPTYGSVYGT